MTKNCFEIEKLPEGVQSLDGVRDANYMWKCWAATGNSNTYVSLACGIPNSNSIGLCKQHYREIVGKTD